MHAQGYDWTFYDTRIGGSQAVHDKQLQLDLNTDFLKSEDGGSWSVGITGTPKQDAPHVRTSVILHVAVEKADSNGPKFLVCESHRENKSGSSAVYLNSKSWEMRETTLCMTPP